MVDSRTQRQGFLSLVSVQGARILLFVAVVALTLIGLVMVYSASSANLISEGASPFSDLISQIIYVCVGVVLAIVVWRISCHAWVGRLLWIVWGISMLLLVLTALIGTESYGARRWLAFGSFSLQPSEFVKITLLLVAVRIIYCVHAGMYELRVGIIQGILCVVIPLAFLYVTESDLGTTIICLVGILAALWFGGVSKRLIVGIVVVGVVLMVFAVVFTDYRNDRLVFINPWDDGQDGYGSGYQIIRSFYAFAEGGIFGVGLGNSHEKYQYLFGSESDYIFAIIGEEFGMVGALVVVVLFLLVLYAGFRIAMESSDDYGRILAASCTLMLVFQAFLNMGCAMGVFPTTGKPLPFISAGGSSVIASMIMVGLIFSVARSSDKPSVYEQRRADLRIVRAQSRREPRRQGQSGYGRDVQGGYGRVSGRDVQRGYGRQDRRGTARGSGRDGRRGSGRGSGRDDRRGSGRGSQREFQRGLQYQIPNRLQRALRYETRRELRYRMRSAASRDFRASRR